MCCSAENPNPSNPNTSGGNSSCDETKEKCPCQPISGVEVISVDYLSDHDLLKDEKAKWTDSGVSYPKPEWLKGRAQQSPVSHTMEKPVKLKVTLKVKPDNACPETGDLECTGPNGLNFKLTGITYKPGENKFDIQSSGNLLKKVQKLNFNLNWKAKPTSGTFSSTTQNELFETIDTPIDEGKQEDGATYKRMAKAVGLVGATGSTDPHTIVAALMKKFPAYTLEVDPAVPAIYNHPTYFNTSFGGAWAMADYVAETGECQAIVRFVRGVIKQVGCPGDAKVMMVWSDPNVNNGNTVIEQEMGAGLASVEKMVSGKKWYAALADSPVSVGKTYSMDEKDADYVGMNNFEACLKFTHNGVSKYYGGGAGVYDTKEQVIHAFTALVWYSVKTTGGVSRYKIEQIVKRY